MWIEFDVQCGDSMARVEAYAWPEVPAKRSGHPDNWEPPEPGGVDVERVFWTDAEGDGDERELKGAELARWNQVWDEAVYAAAMAALNERDV
jgi:hypothetical protein